MAQNALYQKYSAYYQKASFLYQRPEIKASLEILMSVFTVTLLAFLAIRPTITNIATLQKKIQDQEVVLKKADTKIAQLLKAESVLSENQNFIDLLNRAVPDSLVYADIAKRLEILAKENNLRFNSMKLPAVVLVGNKVEAALPAEKTKDLLLPNEKGIYKVGVNFQVAGGQKDAFAFLGALEKIDMVAMVESVKLTKIERTMKDQGQGLAIDGRVWFYSFARPEVAKK